MAARLHLHLVPLLAGLLASVVGLLLVEPTASTPTTGGQARDRGPLPGDTVPASSSPEGPDRWKLVFSDEFTGTRLDLDTWRPNWLAGSDHEITKPVNSAELAAYDPRQVRVRNGSLRLRAVARRTTDNRGRTYPYASGLVQSHADRRFRYGYVEARIFLRANSDPTLGRVGSCGPNWPAFWLNGDDHPEDGEIDIMECLSDDDVAWHYHWSGGSAGGYPSPWSGRMPGGGGWHTFGVDWEPGRLRFYYDGRQVGTHTTGVTGSPHYLILNNGISDPAVQVPSTLRIDYVRVWRRK